MSLKIDLVRPDDLLNLRIEAVNLRLNTKNPKKPFLTVANGGKPAYLIVSFPPQSIEETAYFENSVVPSAIDPTTSVPVQPGIDDTKTDPETDRAKREKDLTQSESPDPPGVIVINPPPPQTQRKAVAKMAHPTRLVFKVQPNTKIPYSVQGLLDWSKLDLQVNPIAAIGDSPTPDQIKNAPAIKEPKQTETALELPYQLLISPTSDVTWTHQLNPFTTKGRTELWHTRLLLNTEKGPVELSKENRASLRAIWSNYPQYDPRKRPKDVFAKDPDLGRTAMSTDDRWQIVILTSAFHGYEVETTLSISPLPMKNTAKKKTSTKKAAATYPAANIAATVARYRYVFEGPYVPIPFYAEQLMLSSLGGWLRSRGNWTPPHRAKEPPTAVVEKFHDAVAILRKPQMLREAMQPTAEPAAVLPQMFAMAAQPTDVGQLDLSEWVHVATQGRDHYVRIVYEGELWPFRHKAALIKVTERKFKETGGIVGAYLMQRMFIVVREPEKQLSEPGSPFKMVRLTTTVTPNIADPIAIKDPDDPTKTTVRSFWVEVATTLSPREKFRFHAIGKDWSDNLVDFTIPLVFVSISDLPDAKPENTVLVRNAYNASNMTDARDAYLFGQKVAFTPLSEVELDKDGNKIQRDNTRLVTEKLNFVVDALGSQPKMLTAQVKIPQIQELLGKDAATTIAYYKEYVQKGFDKANEAFAQITGLGSYEPADPFAGLSDQTLGLNFTSDQAGGFATPNMNLSTLTRKLGPVAGDITNAVKDIFDPNDFFKGVTAQLFGAFNLIELLMPTSMGENAPKLKTETQDIQDGKLLKAIIDWAPKIQNVSLSVVKFENKGKDNKDSVLTIHGEIQKTVKTNGIASPPTFLLTGKLTDFIVTILDSVAVNFTEFSFKASDSKKPDVNVKLYPSQPVEFKGDLQFIEEIRQAIPPGLFGSGASLDIIPQGIKAGFSFAVPPISVGVFSLRDLNLGAAITLPFIDGKPTFDFNISEREHPFLLAVYFFGGTGFFRLQLDTLGMRELEAALEFGATASVDLGVASGEAHIMAGIYFSLQRKDDGRLLATLTGYLRLGGSLSVLGIIRVSIEFNLSFTYQGPDPSRAYGRAKLTIEVDLLFFSISVEVTVERSFGGSAPADPPFEVMFSEETWEDYALAFA